MENKHTPGPWEFTGRQSNRGVITYRVQTLDGQEVTSIFYDTKNEESRNHCRANAHLIAAAPEMIEALKRFTDACTAEVVMGRPDLINACLEACRVIGKADGRHTN